MQLILGTGRSKLSPFLYKKIIEEAYNNKDKQYYIIVPEQFTLETQKEVVRLSKKGCILNIDILSFERLGYKLLKEIGQVDVLPEEGKTYILGKISKNLKKELKVLGKNIDKIGYLEEVKSILSEFAQYNLQSEHINQLIKSNQISKRLKDKLEDIEILRQEYSSYIGGKRIPKEKLLIYLSENLDKSSLVRDAVFAFNGFTGFTPDQKIFINALLKVCLKSYMTVVWDIKLDFHKNILDTDLFSLSRKTILDMEELCVNSGIKFQKPIIVETDDNKNEKIEAFIGAISNPREEVEFIKHEILKYIRQGYDYSDIGIISCNDSYLKIFSEVLSKNSIPYFINDRRTLLTHSFCQWFRYAIEIEINNYSYESVFKYLKSGYSKISYEDVCEIENYCLALGIKGKKTWHNNFVRIPRYLKKEKVDIILGKINKIREAFVEETDKFIQEIKAGQVVDDYIKAIKSFFEMMNSKKELEIIAARKESYGDITISQEYLEVFDMTIQTINSLGDVLGGEKASTQEFLNYLELGLNNKKLKILPSTQNQIIIGNIERTRLGDIKVLFISGANDGYLPQNDGSIGIINDLDRNFIKKENISLAPTRREKIGRGKFYFYLHCEKPSEKLILTYSAVDMKDEKLNPSFLIGDFKKNYKPQVLNTEDLDIYTKDEALNYIYKKSKDGDKVSSYEDIMDYLYDDVQSREKLKNLVSALNYRNPGDRLSKEKAEKIFGQIIESSISKLGRYSMCPYQFFLEYGLFLKEREEYTFGALDEGIIAHGILEAFGKEVLEENIEWKNLSDKDIKRILEKVAETKITDYGNMIIRDTKRNEYAYLRMKDSLEFAIKTMRDSFKIGEFEPVGYEVLFSGENVEAMNIDLGEDRKLIINGKIDRIDEATGIVKIDSEKGDNENNIAKRFVTTTDYKTGDKKFKLEEVYDGTDFQLPIYEKCALEIRENLTKEKTLPAGFGYNYVQRKNISINTINEKKIKEEILKYMKPRGYYNSREEILEKLGSKEEISNYFDVSYKKDGELKSESKVLSEVQIKTLIDYALYKAREIGLHMVDGDIEANPITNDNGVTCDYCKYCDICQFDKRIDGFEVKKATSNTKTDELFNLMELKINGNKLD